MSAMQGDGHDHKHFGMVTNPTCMFIDENVHMQGWMRLKFTMFPVMLLLRTTPVCQKALPCQAEPIYRPCSRMRLTFDCSHFMFFRQAEYACMFSVLSFVSALWLGLHLHHTAFSTEVVAVKILLQLLGFVDFKLEDHWCWWFMAQSLPEVSGLPDVFIPYSNRCSVTCCYM